MKTKYQTVIIITLLLTTLSVSISTINYFVSLKETELQLKNQALPLSLDNIYSEIQKQIVEPHLVSSMMAHDTFVKDWIDSGESSTQKISQYLSAIKNKYGMFTTFLISNYTKNYYTHKGLLRTVSKENKEDTWYYDFLDSQDHNKINLDINKDISDSMILFINVKIFDYNFDLLGVTGIGIKISNINEMLEKFHQQYHFKVYFINRDGDIVISENPQLKNISEIKELAIHKKTIISKTTNIIQYKKNDTNYIINTKYIPELNLYLLVEANLDSFTKNVKNIFYFNLFLSLLVTFIVALIIASVVRKNQKELQYLADNDSLTNLKNRRVFTEAFTYFIRLSQRDKNALSLLFIDLDNFKSINDTYGHTVGDEVLKRVANLLKRKIRSTDVIARWGGEEFVILFINTQLNEAQSISQKLLTSLQHDFPLQKLIHKGVTASLGLTACLENDTIHSATSRADEAMYKAKENGKNQLVVL